jgi:hypothetical protein
MKFTALSPLSPYAPAPPLRSLNLLLFSATSESAAVSNTVKTTAHPVIARRAHAQTTGRAGQSSIATSTRHATTALLAPPLSGRTRRIETA